jgi:hypothetical protein
VWGGQAGWAMGGWGRRVREIKEELEKEGGRDEEGRQEEDEAVATATLKGKGGSRRKE